MAELNKTWRRTGRRTALQCTFLLMLLGLQVSAKEKEGAPKNKSCEGSYKCEKGILLPIWHPNNPSTGDKVARAIVYFVALIYMFLGVSIVADRFMASIEVITSQEKEITIKKPDGETITTYVRIWNETVSNLTLMALGSSAPEILLSIIEICGHNFKPGQLGPSTIVGSAAFNMFVILGVCIWTIPEGESRHIKHLRVFCVTSTMSIFAYIWLYLILSVVSPSVVEVWEAILTFMFFPLCVGLAWVADRRLLFYRFLHKKFRAHKSHGIIVGSEGEPPRPDIEMDGRMLTYSKTESMLPNVENKELDESRREMIRLLKELKQKYPERDLDQLVEMANYQALTQQTKSRAFYRIQATRMMIGAGNILRKHAADQARRAASEQLLGIEEENKAVSRVCFEPAAYQCFENCGSCILTVVRKGGDPSLILNVHYKTENGTATAGSDFEFSEGTLVFKPGETQKEITVSIIDDDIFEEDEHFYVRLSDVYSETSNDEFELNHVEPMHAVLDEPTVATVTIFDDDHAGIFTFEEKEMHVSESIGTMEARVLRMSGARGTVVVPYHTIDGTAKGGGDDYDDTFGELEFHNDEIVRLKEIDVCLPKTNNLFNDIKHGTVDGTIKSESDACRADGVKPHPWSQILTRIFVNPFHFSISWSIKQH
uniref:Solute carrier family 8 member 3 n=1 Tax=Eptatretus burgeri TaxID=7764 RepID=A0A8C4WVS0_EPTBU